MIKVYPTEIKAVDDSGRKVFTMTMFDEASATLNMHTIIGLNEMSLVDLYDAINKAIALLRIEK